MKTTTAFFLGAVLLASMSAVQAQNTPDANGPNSGEMKFSANINAACNLQNFVDGVVIANTNQTTMSSTLSGGSASLVRIRVNANQFSLVLGRPQLIGPYGVEPDVSFTMTPVGSGTNLQGVPKPDFSAVNGTLFFDSGIYNIVLNGQVTKNTGAFEAGAYVLRVPVTCVAAAA